MTVNTAAFGAEQGTVVAAYPTARCVWHSDSERFKVYRMDGDCWVAISAGWETQTMAWCDAARKLKEGRDVQSSGQ